MEAPLGADPLERHRAAVRARLGRAGHVPLPPGSITRRVHGEMIVALGWGRAILLQLAHPAVAAGVQHHSTFRGSLRASLGRMRSTVRAMLWITFGDTERMVAAAAGINAIHARVRGAGYSARDPELQHWVHATLLDSTRLTYERFVGPLTGVERDLFCSEAAIMEPLLGMSDGCLPREAASLEAYLEETLEGGRLVITDTSRALARAVLYPPRWYLAWPAFRPMQLLTIGTLPPALRDAYGFPWSARDERELARWTVLLRTFRRLLPPFAREWPMARDKSPRPR
jgi:uncharacterized protein (DUF2236 family)